MGRGKLTTTTVEANPAPGSLVVNCAVDIAVDNFVDRLFGGEHHDEIRGTRTYPETSSLPPYQRAAVTPFHVKHC